MSNFINDLIKNSNDQIKYKNTVTTGEITKDNGDGTYAVKINNADEAIPVVDTLHYDAIFSVGEIVTIGNENSCKESPKILGHAKKLKQEPIEVEVDYTGGGSGSDGGSGSGARVETIHAYGLRTTSAYLEGEITLFSIGNCTTRGFRYGLTDAYGSETHEDGSFGEGTYSLQITGLAANTIYHYQAYITDANGDEQLGEDKTMITDGVLLYENQMETSVGWANINRPYIQKAQHFTAESNHTIEKIELYLLKYNSAVTGTAYIDIYNADGSGFPTGEILSTISFNTSGLPDKATGLEWDWSEYTLNSPINITSGSEIVIVVRFPDGLYSNSIYWGLYVPRDASGRGLESENTGVTWVKDIGGYYDGNPIYTDYTFKIYGR